MTDTDPPDVELGKQPAANIAIGAADGGRMAENIVHFARLLRAAGLRIGPDRIKLGIEAVIASGLDDPRRLYWTLHAVFVTRRADRDVFTQAFVMFWKDPNYLEQMLSLVVPNFKSNVDAEDKALSRRLSESLFREKGGGQPPDQDPLEIEARGTFSMSETCATKDFADMNAAELAAARRAMTRLALPFDTLKSRRFAPSGRGRRLDLKAVIRDHARHGGDHLRPHWRKRIERRPPLVVLCDISGSMDTYARVLLHFVHALTNDRDRVSVFLFGTRLTHITRALRNRDPDVAITDVGQSVNDWSGGTRIGGALDDFNRHWARRVLGQNATVLMITDGLDREGAAGIEQAARRLSANCRRLIWLNPLMRYEAYEPIAAGAAALDRHVDDARTCHNLASLADLARSLSGASQMR